MYNLAWKDFMIVTSIKFHLVGLHPVPASDDFFICHFCPFVARAVDTLAPSPHSPALWSADSFLLHMSWYLRGFACWRCEPRGLPLAREGQESVDKYPSCHLGGCIFPRFPGGSESWLPPEAAISSAPLPRLSPFSFPASHTFPLCFPVSPPT